MSNNEILNLKNKFFEFYGQCENKIQFYKSPARINIIGEHIDYNGGKVFPCAIDRYLYVAVRKRNDSKINYRDLKFTQKYSFDINDEFTYKKENGYANYLNGILSIIKCRGFSFKNGIDVLISSEIPSASGISSSSALECGFAFAVSDLFGFDISKKDIALIGQQSEHEFMNVNCGIMDQYIISTAREGTAELLDCAKIEHEYIPLELGDYRFVVMNTKKKRQLADSKYNERRSQCEKGLADLKKAGFNYPDLCSITLSDFIKSQDFIKDEIILHRVRHCVTENDRVLDSVEALKKKDLVTLGKLLCMSHSSLKNDYEVTGVELDTLVENALLQEGCLGARMTGAGFGGCAIALVKEDSIPLFIENVQRKYVEVIGYEAEFFSCSTSDGVTRVE